MERSIESMRTEIVAQQERVILDLRSIRDELNSAYLEHKRGTELIRKVKIEMDTMKQKWHQSIDLQEEVHAQRLGRVAPYLREGDPRGL